MDRTTSPKIAQVDLLQESAMCAVDSVAEHIRSIDEELRRVDYFLHKFQPPHDGRIRIRWVVRRDHSSTRENDHCLRLVPVCWYYVKKIRKFNFRELPIANLSRRARTNRAFHDTAREVAKLLEIAQELFVLRANAVKRLSTWSMSVTLALRAQEPKLDRRHTHLNWFDLTYAEHVTGSDGAVEEPGDDELLADE